MFKNAFNLIDHMGRIAHTLSQYQGSVKAEISYNPSSQYEILLFIHLDTQILEYILFVDTTHISKERNLCWQFETFFDFILDIYTFFLVSFQGR